MYPMIPGEAMSGAVEMVWCFFAVVTAAVSYFFSLRF